MPDFQRSPQKFVTQGVDLAHPPDLLQPGRYPILKNVRQVQGGVLETRSGMVLQNQTPLDQPTIHSIRRLNDQDASPFWTRIVGAGTKVYSGQGNLSQQDAGYSSDPLSLVQIRPDASPETWMYIADSLRMRKIRVDGLNYQIGIQPPLSAPLVEIAQPLFKAVDELQVIGAWAATAPATPIVLPFRVTLNTNIAAIIYDSGSTGWCCIKPTNSASDFSYFGVGARYVCNGTDTATLEEVHQTVSTTIGAIFYDSGSTGPCTIQPTTSVTGYQRNAMVQLGGGEYVRILSVTQGPDGITSFRCNALNTHAAGDAIGGFVSFRFYLPNTYSVGMGITAHGIQTQVPVTAPAASATGYISLNESSPLDLTSVNGRPLGPDDYIHISLQSDNVANLSEGRLMLDVDANTTSTPNANDFTKNFYYLTFRANDFVPVAQGTLTSVVARQRSIQRNIVDSTTVQGPRSAQTSTGNGEWTELIFKVSDLTRVGPDTSVSLSAVKALRISFTVSATTVFTVSSWWIGGGYGPDVGLQGAPYLYRFRYRSSTTGAKSIQGPATRYGVEPSRQRVIITPPAASADPQVDTIDIERFGGANDGWNWIASVPNSGAAVNDDWLDADIVGRPALETDTYQPFPITDLPRKGTCNVAGTAVTWVSGDTFNTNWAPGIDIIVNGVPYTLYGQPGSTTFLQTVENIGTATGVPFSIPDPTILGQPVQRMFGPYGEGTNTGLFNFAVGDPINPGTVYCTKGNDPDSAPDNYQLEVTSPSEPLMNGIMYGGRAILFSSERAFELRPSFGSAQGAFPFVDQELSVGVGLFAPWALAVGGGAFYFLGKDGIYASNGGPAQCITDDTLYPLFPHEGAPGAAVNGFQPPDMSTTAYLRLSYYDGFLYFDYRDTAGNAQTLAFDMRQGSQSQYSNSTINRFGWFPYTYLPGVLIHYGEEGDRIHSLLLGSTIGNLYQEGGIIDDVSGIACQVRTPAFNAGDTRARKLFGDVMVDFESQTFPITLVPGFDNYTALLGASTLSSGSRAQQVIDLLSGFGQFAQNMQLDFTWNTQSGVIKLYEWQPSFVIRPEDTLLRVTDNDNAGYQGAKYVRGALIEADTEGIARTVNLLYDGTNLGATLTVNHNGQLIKPYAVTPYVGELLRAQPTDAGQWRLFKLSYIFDKYPELAAIYSAIINLGYPGSKFMQGIRLTADTGGAAVSFNILYDGGTIGATLPATTFNGKQMIPFAFPVPFIAHDLQIQPLGAARVFLEETEWDWQPAPELVTTWITQFTNHDLQGFQSFRDAYIALISANAVTLNILDDLGNTFPYTVPSTAGLHRKPYVPLQPMKGKLFQYQLTSPAGFRLFLKDCEVRVKQWGDPGPYRVVHPFGDYSRQTGARI